MRSSFTTAFLLLAGLSTAVFAEETQSQPDKDVAAQPVKPIRFEPSLEKASELGRTQKRVVVAYFTASWCGYCRKMEALSFPDEEVKRHASKFVWTKIDIDRQPAHAARFGIRSVPAFGFLNVRGEVLHVAPGYRAPDQLVDLLKRNVSRAEAPGQVAVELERVEKLIEMLKGAKQPAEMAKAVVENVTLLASPERRQRGRTRSALLGRGKRAWPGLLSCLSHRHLAVRAAGYDLLSEATGHELHFDAFAPLKQRAEQLRAWSDWIGKNAKKP